MPEVIDRLRLSPETVERIRARLLTDAAAGLEPTDPAYPDLILGAVHNDIFGAASIEFARVYDRSYTEAPAKALPTTTDGTWLDAWADAFGLERLDETYATGIARFTTPPGTAARAIPAGLEITTEQVAEDEPELAYVVDVGGETPAGGGDVDLPITAVDPGSAGNVPANAVVLIATGIQDVSVSNPAAITGGSDVESDERLSARVARKLSKPAGGGNIADYENWALARPGVGFVTVQAVFAGPNTVRLMLTDVNNDPLSPQAIAAEQDYFDPVPGEGRGKAPVGHTVTVDSPDVLAVAAVGEIRFRPGYSLDGTAGTQAMRAEITAALAGYVDRLASGEDVIWNKAVSAIVSVAGGVAVDDVTALTLNGVADDVAVAGTELASLTQPPTLTEV